ncbi:MAG TPA: hypothetical protein ENG18_01485 [Nitrososphaeria archaeon]|nr:hypothetical protein [Nitrososphaeria archaeon]
MSLEKLFNDVEEALTSIAEEIEGVEEVTVSEPSLQRGFKSPRIFVWIRDGEMKDVTIGGRRMHSWRFEYVIDAVSGDSARAYSQAKRIMWELYSKIMNDRSLGGLVRDAKPIRFERIEAPSEKVYGHRIYLVVEVIVEA